VPKVHIKPNKSQKKGLRRKEQRKPKCSLVWRTGLSGAPLDSVRCTREDRPQTLQLRVFQAQLRYNSPDCPVCQRSNDYLRATVDSDSEQCSTMIAAEVRAVGQRGTGLSGVAPDCPVTHEDKASNGRPAPSPNGRMTWRHTGHCPVRLSPAAFSNGYNLVGGYEYHPNQPLQCVGAQATFQVI
jgi:hypothetical protein